MLHTFQGHFVWIVIIFPYLEFVEISVVEEVGETSIKAGIGEYGKDIFLAGGCFWGTELLPSARVTIRVCKKGKSCE
jgi:hypothetical protein